MTVYLDTAKTYTAKMPKLVTPLTDIQVRNAKPKDKAYKLADGAGMYLLVILMLLSTGALITGLMRSAIR